MRLLWIALLAFGCKSQKATPQATVGAVTEAQAQEFADKLVRDVRPCDEAKLAGSIDAAAMAARFAKTQTAPGTAALARRLATSTTAAHVLCAWLDGITSYTLVGVRMIDGAPRPVMRRMLEDPSGALFINYDQLQLGAGSDGAVRIVDVLAYRQGTWLSELLGANLDAKEIDFFGATAAPDEVRRARDLLRSGDAAGTLAVLDTLPAPVRAERGVMLLRVNAAASVSQAAYELALNALAEAFPTDPVIALTELDGALGRDHDATMRWLALLEKEIGPDAYLDALRAISYVRTGDLDEALAQADAAVKREPTLTRAHEIKMDVLIARKDWDGVLGVMTELEQHHGMRFEEAKLRGEPRLAELVASPAFATWLAGH